MASVIDQVLAFCEADEQLSSLANDHPLLLDALDCIPSLTVPDVLSILAAVENEQFQLVQEVERLKGSEGRGSDIHEFSLIADSGKRSEGEAMLTEDLLGLLGRLEEVNLVLQQRIMQFSRSTQAQAAVVEEVALPTKYRDEDLKKLCETQKAELDRKQVEIHDLEERNDYLAQELSSYLQSVPRVKSGADALFTKLAQVKKDSEQLRKQNEELMSEVKERQTLLKSNSSLRQKLSGLEAKLKTMNELIEKSGSHTLKGRRLWLLSKTFMKKELSRAYHKWVNRAKPTNAKIAELKQRTKALFSGMLACVYSHFSLSPLILRLRGSYISIPWLQMLLESCSGDLLELDLSDCSLTDQGVGLVLNWLQKGGRVQRLLLRNNALTSEVTSEVLCMHGVSTLDLSQNEVTVGTFNTELIDIRLSGCQLGGRAVSEFLAFVQNSKVQRLDLSYNSVSPSHMRDCLQKLTIGRLKSLNLSGWLLSDSHSSQLLAVISSNTTLEDLHIAKVPLSAASFDSIIARLRALPNLTSVDFSGCKVKVDSVARLMNSCQSLRQVILKDLVFSAQDYNTLVKAIESATHLEVCLIDSK